MKTYNWNITIDKSNEKEMNELLKDITEITWNLSIYSEAKLEANNLKRVWWYLYINSEAKLEANNLKSVWWYLYINSKAKLEANNLKSVWWNLSIYSKAKLEANNLKSVWWYLSINSKAKLEANNLKSVWWYLYINSEAKLDNLKSVWWYLSIYSDIWEELSKQLYKYNKANTYYLTNNSPEYLLEQNLNWDYKIKDVSFEKKLFDKIRKDKLTAKEVFEIRNIEQRRIAYEFMDKIKMKELAWLKILEEEIDNQGNEMKIITFNIDNMELKYYNCFCPSTKREYFLETESDTCKEAKAMSFWDSEIKFDEEY